MTRYKRVYYTLGYHPKHACNDGLNHKAEISWHLQQSYCVGLGEVGLDEVHHYDNPTPRPCDKCSDQEKLLEEILTHYSKEGCRKALVIHCRPQQGTSPSHIHGRCLRILRRSVHRSTKIHFHNFTGTVEDLEEISRAFCDAYFGVSTSVCHADNREALQKMIKQIPANHLLLETDAPHLAHHPLIQKWVVQEGSSTSTTLGILYVWHRLWLRYGNGVSAKL